MILPEKRKIMSYKTSRCIQPLCPTNTQSLITGLLLQPLYHQPTDTEVYMENKRQYAGFKRRLMEYFKKRHADKNSRDAHLTQTYSKLMTEWLKKVEKVRSRNGLQGTVMYLVLYEYCYYVC